MLCRAPKASPWYNPKAGEVLCRAPKAISGTPHTAGGQNYNFKAGEVLYRAPNAFSGTPLQLVAKTTALKLVGCSVAFPRRLLVQP